jgi:carbamoyl-phosphate synthase large subunit
MQTIELNDKPERVMVLGSGALQIGQAGEFDYSGSQAIKALREEGIFTIVVNPNIATIQTSQDLVDRVYLLAVVPDIVEEIIAKESVDGILLSFGGQTALNCGVELADRGVFEKYGVRVLGTPVDVVKDTVDRKRFNSRLAEIDVNVARSIACHSAEEATVAAEEIGFPLMLRGAYALGGKGSGVVQTKADLANALKRAFDASISQVLVEEYLGGWKEIEYEVVRDRQNNCITVCNMENLDPMGIHTGESIVVAPSQTLNDEEYQLLRSISIRIIQHLGVVGECNVQFALDPESLDYRVIEVNARLSRSSALASKATGYPLAYVGAKLALGYCLPDIPNSVTGTTTAFFEPALDYLACKVPRWDLTKFHGAVKEIGTEMKSVGEVMALGRDFPEVIQKALRMLDIGVDGLDPDVFQFESVTQELERATPRRIFAVAQALKSGQTVDHIHKITRIDRWFLEGLARIVATQARIVDGGWPVDEALLKQAKLQGFSDHCIGKLLDVEENEVRRRRHEHGVKPHIVQVDTLAAEFPARTNYLYLTYQASISETRPSERKKILVLGSGVYRIGSSVEFDWCCVNAVRAISELGHETIMLNYNPETVSTDYDECDRLVFDEISLERVLDVCEVEKPDGIVVSMGGQIANNLAIRLHRAGMPILGTAPEDIDRAEDRQKFSSLLDELGIDQPRWAHVTDVSDVESIVEELGGYPVLVRPSYVLSGAAMSVAHEPHELKQILGHAKRVSPVHPVVVSKFETHAREIEIDAVADQGKIVLWAISEHIEDAGIHSGDATLVLPPQTLYISTIRRVKKIAVEMARALNITGPFNAQFLAKNNEVKVIECNLRASRSFPFVSKVTGHNFAAEAMRRMLGVSQILNNNSLDLDYVGVKVPMFSFGRLTGVDPLLGVEMASTGEVGCLGMDLDEALLSSLLATGFRRPTAGVLLSLGPIQEKYSFADEARTIIDDLGLPLYATEGTAEMLHGLGISCRPVAKVSGGDLTAMELIEGGEIDMVINVPREYDSLGRPDGYFIRRRAVDAAIPLFTDLKLASAVIGALRRTKNIEYSVRALDEYVTQPPPRIRN